MGSPRTRARYWARSFAGWHDFSRIQPNAAHESLSRLQQRGWIDSVITQVNDHQTNSVSVSLHLSIIHGGYSMSCSPYFAE